MSQKLSNLSENSKIIERRVDNCFKTIPETLNSRL